MYDNGNIGGEKKTFDAGKTDNIKENISRSNAGNMKKGTVLFSTASNKAAKADDDKMELYDWVQCIVTALIAGVLIFMFVGRIIRVDGTSMVPTLLHDDRLVVSNLFYEPKYGDIVVLQTDTFGPDPIVKRVIATENQEVDIDFENGIVYVDGVPMDEPYTNSLTTKPLDFVGPVTVPEGCVFVMGDNRNASTDSRSDRVGMVDERCIIGKAYFIIMPGINEHEERDFSRIGSVYS